MRIEEYIRASENVPANVKVLLSVQRASEFAGYRALTATFDGTDKRRDIEFLLSDDGTSLVRLTRLDLSKDPYEEITDRITLQGRPARGCQKRKIVAVLYDDFECPFCARVHQTLFPELLKEYGDRVTFVYKDFPLSDIHPWAKRAAINAGCLAVLNSEAYWDFTDYIHANQGIVNADGDLSKQLALLNEIALQEAAKFDLDSKKLQFCLKAQDDRSIKDSVKEGEAVGVTGTPTIFINGERLTGAVSASELRAAFDRAIRESHVNTQKASAAQP